MPAARLPSTATRSDAQINTLADGRVTAGTIAAARSQATFDSEVDGRVADEALNANVERWPKTKVPSDTLYGAAAQLPPVPAVGDAGGFVAVNSAGNALEYVDAPSGGGGGSTTPAVLRSVQLASQLVVTVPGSGAWSAWNTIAEITVGATETGACIIFADVAGVSAPDATAGGDRATMQIQIVRVRGASTETIVSHTEYEPRRLHDGSADYIGSTNSAQDSASVPDTSQSGDVYRVQVRYVGQDDTPRSPEITMTHAADATNRITLFRSAAGGLSRVPPIYRTGQRDFPFDPATLLPTSFAGIQNGDVRSVVMSIPPANQARNRAVVARFMAVHGSFNAHGDTPPNRWTCIGGSTPDLHRVLPLTLTANGAAVSTGWTIPAVYPYLLINIRSAATGAREEGTWVRVYVNDVTKFAAATVGAAFTGLQMTVPSEDTGGDKTYILGRTRPTTGGQAGQDVLVIGATNIANDSPVNVRIRGSSG